MNLHHHNQHRVHCNLKTFSPWFPERTISCSVKKQKLALGIKGEIAYSSLFYVPLKNVIIISVLQSIYVIFFVSRQIRTFKEEDRLKKE